MSGLAFDTSTDVLTVALGDGTRIFAERNLRLPRRHLERLVPTIAEVIDEVEMGLSDLQTVSVGIGPGSFTGLRIGVATARGLAQALGTSLVGLPSLEVIAAGAEQSGTVCSIVGSRPGEFYYCFYAVENGHPKQISQIAAGSILEVESHAKALGGPVVFTGPGVAACKADLGDNLANCVFEPESSWYPRAANLLRLAGGSEPEREDDSGGAGLQPLYLNRPEVEERLGDPTRTEMA